MRKYPIYVTWAQGKTPNTHTLCITWGSKLKKKNNLQQYNTHKNVQNYYNAIEFAICTKNMES